MLIGLASLYRQDTENRAFLLENAVFLELRRRGLKLHYGALENGKELDFLAELPERKWQKIQVTKRLTPENQASEMASFLHAEPYLAGGESLLLVEEGERETVNIDGLSIRVEPVIRWTLGV